MVEVIARAAPGSLIQLDQCGKCGGIWCDKWELYPIDGDEAERLDPLDQSLLRDKIRLMRDFGEPVGGDVPDPYYSDDGAFEEVFDILDACCRRLLAELTR